MIRKEKKGVVWWEFELFQGHPIRHGIFSRLGGVSEGLFASLNTSDHTGDDSTRVANNISRIQDIFELPAVQCAKQVHGIEIAAVEAACEAPICDALVTQAAQMGLMIRHADCQPAIVYDPKNGVLANIHCGWRGNVQNIYGRVISHLESTFGSSPKDLLVGIGPSLGPANAQFLHYKTEFPDTFWQYQHRPYYFDLWAIALRQLTEAGVLSAHIQIAEMDTYKDARSFFSFRRDGATGRNATVAAIFL